MSPGRYIHNASSVTVVCLRMSSKTKHSPDCTEESGDTKKGQRKMGLRKRIKLEMKAMSEAAVEAASSAVVERLLKAPELATSGGGAVSVYLSMPGEVDTAAVVSELFKRRKKVYIPKVL